jgi:hypothetical protein
MFLAFASFGNAGSAFVTVLSLAAAVIIGAYVLAYAAHSLVTVVESTAAGNDAIRWPDEPIADWIARGIFLGALLMIWLAPSAMLSRSLSEDWLEGDGGLRFILLAVPGVWLFFPIGLLSTLSASSRWIIFRASIVWVMLRVLPSTLMFYFLSGIICVITALAWYVAVCKEGGLPVAFVAGPLAATTLLIYARLLGRLSMMIHRLNPTKAERDEKPKKKKKRPRPVEEVEELSRAEEQETADVEPEASTGIMLQEEARRETRPQADPVPQIPAELQSAAEKPTEPDEFPLLPLERDEEYENRWKEEVDDGPAVPYGLDGAAAKAPEYRPIEDYDMDEMGPLLPEEERRTGDGIVTQLARPREQPKPKRKRQAAAPIGAGHPWLHGVFGFPFYSTTLGAWMWLSVGLTVFGVLCNLVAGNYPRGE